MAADNKNPEGEAVIITGVSRGIDNLPKRSIIRLQHVISLKTEQCRLNKVYGKKGTGNR